MVGLTPFVGVGRPCPPMLTLSFVLVRFRLPVSYFRGAGRGPIGLTLMSDNSRVGRTGITGSAFRSTLGSTFGRKRWAISLSVTLQKKHKKYDFFGRKAVAAREKLLARVKKIQYWMISRDVIIIFWHRPVPICGRFGQRALLTPHKFTFLQNLL